MLSIWTRLNLCRLLKGSVRFPTIKTLVNLWLRKTKIIQINDVTLFFVRNKLFSTTKKNQKLNSSTILKNALSLFLQMIQNLEAFESNLPFHWLNLTVQQIRSCASSNFSKFIKSSRERQ